MERDARRRPSFSRLGRSRSPRPCRSQSTSRRAPHRSSRRCGPKIRDRAWRMTPPPAFIHLSASPTSAWGIAAWCLGLPLPFRGKTPVAACAGSSSRCPFAMDHSMTAAIRWCTRRAVSRLPFQIGTRTASTSPVVISSTRLSPIKGQACFSNEPRHAASFLEPRHESLCNPITASTACRNVGIASPLGSRPCALSRAFLSALSRASERFSKGIPANPYVERLAVPAEPLGPTFRQSAVARRLHQQGQAKPAATIAIPPWLGNGFHKSGAQGLGAFHGSPSNITLPE